MNDLDYLKVLIGVESRKSFREIAEDIGKSTRWAYHLFNIAVEEKHAYKLPGLARERYLTDEGRAYIKINIPTYKEELLDDDDTGRKSLVGVGAAGAR